MPSSASSTSAETPKGGVLTNLQLVLDNTAKIAGGGPAVGARAGVYAGAGGIAGVKVAWSLPPDAATLSNDGVCHVSLWDSTVKTGGAGDLVVYAHRIRMKLLLGPGRSDFPTAYSILTPFVPLYEVAFNAHIGLNGSAMESHIEGYTGIKADDIYPDRVSLEITLIAVEKQGVTFAL